MYYIVVLLRYAYQPIVEPAIGLLTVAVPLHVAQSERGIRTHKDRRGHGHAHVNERAHEHSYAHAYACARTTYVSSLRGERDLCDPHTGHGSDA